MAKDINKEEWDSATLTKLQFFEQYVHEWLNVVLRYRQENKNQFNTLEIYDLFCGSGYDGTKRHKGSPLRILDAISKRNMYEKKIKVYFNDCDKEKTDELKNIIDQDYKNIQSKRNVEIKVTSFDVAKYKIDSKNFYKLIFLDQYGIKHINKINEFSNKGVDILMFVSSGHIRRFIEDESFKKYLDSKYISKQDFEGKSNYETHRIITQYFKKLFPKKFISPFSLIKDNNNTNGLIFVSTHPKGQEQFLKAAWKVDKNFGESNRNLDNDPTRDITSLFYNKSELSEKEKRYKSVLFDFLKEAKSNLDIKTFGLDNGFLPNHTTSILENYKTHLKCEYFNGANRGFHINNKVLKVKIKYIGD